MSNPDSVILEEEMDENYEPSHEGTSIGACACFFGQVKPRIQRGVRRRLNVGLRPRIRDFLRRVEKGISWFPLPSRLQSTARRPPSRTVHRSISPHKTRFRCTDGHLPGHTARAEPTAPTHISSHDYLVHRNGGLREVARDGLSHGV